MFQWPVIVVLIVSTFVGRVCPVVQKDVEKNTVDVAATLKNAASVASGSEKKAVVPSVETAADKKDPGKPNGTEIASPSNANESTSQKVQDTTDNGKHNCNSTKEATDMLTCYVMPPDDDAAIEQNSETSTAEPTINTVAGNNKTEGNATETQTQKAVTVKEANTEKTDDKTEKKDDKPGKKDDKTEKKDDKTEKKDDKPGKKDDKPEKKDNKTEMVLLDHTEPWNKTIYSTELPETNHSTNVTNAAVPGTDSKPGTNHSEVSISSVAPLLADNVQTAGVKYPDQGNGKSMPSGVIALVTAISFAVVIAMVYIGMIVWRRYIEYRYGHRELLVNELEFDTNDLRHFEL